LIPSKDFIYGFAELHGLLNEEFEEYPFGISIGKRLNDSIVDSIIDGPTYEYYLHYKEINTELNKIATDIVIELKKNKIKCIDIAPTISSSSEEFKKYLDTLRYKISHKMIATRAGLGWIGKTDLLITKRFGPRIRLVTILTDKPVKSIHHPINKSRCGTCDKCTSTCPAQAANGKLWDVNTDRDMFFDARKCREKCGELAKKMLNIEARICGICVSVCPIGKFIKEYE
jgi:epoxyqueuosine reductase QueG